jgi:hypothetical protein
MFKLSYPIILEFAYGTSHRAFAPEIPGIVLDWDWG